MYLMQHPTTHALAVRYKCAETHIVHIHFLFGCHINSFSFISYLFILDSARNFFFFFHIFLFSAFFLSLTFVDGVVDSLVYNRASMHACLLDFSLMEGCVVV